MKQLMLGVVMALVASVAGAQTCEYPWPTSGQYPTSLDQKFSPGFYKHPYTQVIEILGEVCFGYDTLVNDDGQTVKEECVDKRWAFRHVQGRTQVFPVTQPKKTLVWFNGSEFLYPNGYISTDARTGVWGRLPEGCLVPSTVVRVEQGRVVIKY